MLNKLMKFLKKEIISVDTATALFMGIILAWALYHVVKNWNYYGMPWFEKLSDNKLK